MDRIITYPQAIAVNSDPLRVGRFAMIGLAKLAEALLGSGTALYGLSCTPGSGLTVTVDKGQIYSMQPVDASSYSTLPADPTPILKQGLLTSPVTLNCSAPSTPNQSIKYLVQAAFVESDGDPIVFPYFNVADPDTQHLGPDDAGTPQNSTRLGKCVVTIKPGMPDGAPAIPAPDAGNVGLYVVTVAYGQTGIIKENIEIYDGAPFVLSLGGVNTSLEAEAKARTDADNDLKSAMNKIADTSGTAAVLDANLQTSDERLLSTVLGDASTVGSIMNTLQGNLTAESATRLSNDNALQAQIKGLPALFMSLDSFNMANDELYAFPISSFPDLATPNTWTSLSLSGHGIPTGARYAVMTIEMAQSKPNAGELGFGISGDSTQTWMRPTGSTGRGQMVASLRSAGSSDAPSCANQVIVPISASQSIDYGFFNPPPPTDKYAWCVFHLQGYIM